MNHHTQQTVFQRVRLCYCTALDFNSSLLSTTAHYSCAVIITLYMHWNMIKIHHGLHQNLLSNSEDYCTGGQLTQAVNKQDFGNC